MNSLTLDGYEGLWVVRLDGVSIGRILDRADAEMFLDAKRHQLANESIDSMFIENVSMSHTSKKQISCTQLLASDPVLAARNEFDESVVAPDIVVENAN